MNTSSLPELPLDQWKDTLATLHMWSQIVGKIALEKTPLVNHFWNVSLRVTPRGLTTIPLNGGSTAFAIEFDFIAHELVVRCESGETRRVKLEPRTVADFYAAVMAALAELRIEAKIWTMPVEIENPIRFTDDTQHASYDPEYVVRFHKILVWTNRIFEDFRSRFMGKSSPVQFFWGSFDLAVTRFNGDIAPPRPDADYITQESYSRCCISHGFWCGGGTVLEPAFYSYAAPEPDGLKDAAVQPSAGHYDLEMKEFILPYEAVRQAADSEKALLDFMQSTYAAAADLADWKRNVLERPSAAAAL